MPIASSASRPTRPPTSSSRRSLAAAEQAERDQAPEKGLAALAAATPGPRWEERFRQARERLTRQLEQLDAASPTVVLTPEVKLEYKKGEPGTISVRIQDDHGVKSARLFARVEGSVQYVELPLRPTSGSDYVAQISASFHQNQTRRVLRRGLRSLRPHDPAGQRPEASQAQAQEVEPLRRMIGSPLPERVPIIPRPPSAKDLGTERRSPRPWSVRRPFEAASGRAKLLTRHRGQLLGGLAGLAPRRTPRP